MNKEQLTKAEKLVSDHWAYVLATLAAHNIQPGVIEVVRHHYTSAMLHGYKHGWDAAKDEEEFISEMADALHQEWVAMDDKTHRPARCYCVKVDDTPSPKVTFQEDLPVPGIKINTEHVR